MAIRRLEPDEGTIMSLGTDTSPSSYPPYDKMFPVLDIPDELVERYERIRDEWEAVQGELAQIYWDHLDQGRVRRGNS